MNLTVTQWILVALALIVLVVVVLSLTTNIFKPVFDWIKGLFSSKKTAESFGNTALRGGCSFQ